MRSLNRLRRSVALFICPELGVEERPMAVSMDTFWLVRLAKMRSEHVGHALSTTSTYAANDGKFFAGLAAGKGCTVEKATRVMQWLSTHWPDDLDWPSDIPRPSRKSIEEGAA